MKSYHSLCHFPHDLFHRDPSNPDSILDPLLFFSKLRAVSHLAYLYCNGYGMNSCCVQRWLPWYRVERAITIATTFTQVDIIYLDFDVFNNCVIKDQDSTRIM